MGYQDVVHFWPCAMFQTGVKHGSAMFKQVLESTRNYSVKLRVDANGGWNVSEAQHMMRWLADRKVDYIEQPLKEGEESELIHLYKNRPLPIYVDESCRFAENIPAFAAHVDGVNMKLMKFHRRKVPRFGARTHAFSQIY